MEGRELWAFAVRLEAGTLTISGKLEYEEESLFEALLRRLVESDCPSPVVDLSGVERVSSSYVRIIALAMVDVKKDGRSLVVKARSRVARVLKLGGLDRLGTIELAGDQEPDPARR